MAIKALPMVGSPKASCIGCGDCCYPMITGWGVEDPETRARMISAAAEDPGSSAPFVLHHWREIGADEAYAIRPSGFGPPAETEEEKQAEPEWHFMLCDAFDPLTRSCTAYATRPPVCSGYPWYGETPRPQILPEFCSFKADLAEPGRDV
jgi:Fe-S-cluster containining protein